MIKRVFGRLGFGAILKEYIAVPRPPLTGASTLEPAASPRHTPAKAKKPQQNWEEVSAAHLGETRSAISKIVKSNRPIILGPWCSEVGFELLYWIPFLQWVKQKWSIPSSRFLAISRGGVQSWYSNITDQYADILDYCSVDQYRERNDERIRENNGGQKQVIVSTFEKDIIAWATRMHNLGEAELIHPAMMYTLCSYFWKQRLPMRWVQNLAHYQGLSPVRSAALPELPDQYVAVKFYFSHALPDTPANRQFIQQAIANLTQHTNVVLLNTGLQVDDHTELTGIKSDRVITVADHMQASTNLEVQTQVIRGASEFVGTYGGFSYLAPLLGVPAVSFYSDAARFERHHQDLAQRVYDSLNTAGLTVLHTSDAARIAPIVSSGASISPIPVPKVPSPLPTMPPSPPTAPLTDEQRGKIFASVEKKLEGLKRSGRPIVVGPWLGEVGFELLYWIPFLRWATKQFQLPTDRMVIVSRGGSRPWYSGLGERYIDIFDIMSPDEFREGNDERTGPGGGLKQGKDISPFEQGILDAVGRMMGTSPSELLHPALMYGAVRPYYKSQADISYLEAVTTHQRLRPRDIAPEALGLTADLALPSDFVAVKFYFSPNFPDTEPNRALIDHIVGQIRQQHPVVLLDTGIRADDHTESRLASYHDCLSVSELMTPTNNLAVQSHVISQARAFIGTYGGVSYLASFCGTPSVGLFSDAGPFNPRHVELGQYVAALPSFGSLTIVQSSQDTAVQQALNEIILARQPLGAPSV